MTMARHGPSRSKLGFESDGEFWGKGRVRIGTHVGTPSDDFGRRMMTVPFSGFFGHILLNSSMVQQQLNFLVIPTTVARVDATL